MLPVLPVCFISLNRVLEYEMTSQIGQDVVRCFSRYRASVIILSQVSGDQSWIVEIHLSFPVLENPIITLE